ncbi:unnamed protein product [Polarella glacialis]|uniref:Transmembrane protein n=1 Tax=Polarella glacialis TaxID=89957 RepID=A0A813E6T2_POLGL|nr:unnamed protein product [Polarella glacialis]CAE8688754.1 unnamed protein product [Polarella glacialis]
MSLSRHFFVPSAAAPRSLGSCGFRRGLAARLTVGLVLGCLLPGRDFVGPPSLRGRRGQELAASADESSEEASASEASSAEASSAEASLRARVAELERRLSERTAPAPEAQAVEDERPPSPVRLAFERVLEGIPELVDVDNARLGMTDDKAYIFSKGDASWKNPIYKRKYEVMGMALTQQETFFKALGRASKKAKESEAIKELIKFQKEGCEGMTKKEVKQEIAQIEQTSKLAGIVFRDLIPEVTKDPVMDAFFGLGTTFALIIATLLFCLCFFPPLPPEAYDE